jgi:hypothetical protein
MRLQVCGANKFQLDLERQSDADVLALRVTTSRAIDLSLRNRWNCFGPRPRPHTRRKREKKRARTISAGDEAKISMRARWNAVLLLLRPQGVGRRAAKCTSAPGGDIACPRRWPHSWRAIALRCAISALKWHQAPGPGPLQYSFSCILRWPLILIFLKCTLQCVRKFVLPDKYCIFCWWWFKILNKGHYFFLLLPLHPVWRSSHQIPSFKYGTLFQCWVDCEKYISLKKFDLNT